MMGNLSITFKSKVLPKMIKGMLIASPIKISGIRIASGARSAAAATATTLSKLITKSAINMVRIATNKLGGAAISLSSSLSAIN